MQRGDALFGVGKSGHLHFCRIEPSVRSIGMKGDSNGNRVRERGDGFAEKLKNGGLANGGGFEMVNGDESGFSRIAP